MSTQYNQRNSNVELLRIISMMMIIGLHYLHDSMGGALANIEYGSINYYISQVAETVCIISVNIFVLITGYYMVYRKTSSEIRISKPINLYLITIFYGLLFLGLACIFGKQDLSVDNVTRAVIPFIYGRRWFVETYIILLLISPYLTKLLVSLSKKNYFVLLIIWIALFSVWPSFFNNPPIKDGGYGIVHFITLYMISGFIRMHIQLPKKFLTKCFLIMTVVACAICTCFLRNHFSVWNYDFILNILSAACAFYLVLSLKERRFRFVNSIASTTFGVFLIHTDFSLSGFIWHDVLHCEDYYNSNAFVIHFIVSVLLLFIVGCVIDYVRQIFWKYSFDKMLSKISIKIKA